MNAGDEPREMLRRLGDDDFLRIWRRLLGEPPAIVLDRPVMVDILLGALPGSGLPRDLASPSPRPPGTGAAR